MSKLPKKKCCVSKTRCKRCPLRMLKEGTLPDGYGVKRRRLVRIDADGTVLPLEKKDKKSSKKAAKKKAKKKARKKAEKKARAKGQTKGKKSSTSGLRAA
ncbi:MAG: hypothetical protein NTV28_07450 [Propionibacteriales bacterium]|nr:hypothetical protein [Propionibacteriales bacterium]